MVVSLLPFWVFFVGYTVGSSGVSLLLVTLDDAIVLLGGISCDAQPQETQFCLVCGGVATCDMLRFLARLSFVLSIELTKIVEGGRFS